MTIAIILSAGLILLIINSAYDLWRIARDIEREFRNVG